MEFYISLCSEPFYSNSLSPSLSLSETISRLTYKKLKAPRPNKVKTWEGTYTVCVCVRERERNGMGLKFYLIPLTHILSPLYSHQGLQKFYLIRRHSKIFDANFWLGSQKLYFSNEKRPIFFSALTLQKNLIFC